MGLFDEIFPTKRDPRLVQTEWAGDWLDGAAGFGYAAERLTEHRDKFGALIDQAGLAVFFLQRHRVEMTLKGLLDAVGGDVTGKHGLLYLWELCKKALEPKDPAAWKQFAADHRELVKVLDTVDQSSYTFRYPVDTKGRKASRPAFIDLEVLNEHVERMYFGAVGYVDHLSANGL